MSDLFVDTSGWASSFDRTQRWHSEAREVISTHLQAGGRLVTTNPVLIELAALLTSPMRISKSEQIEFLRELRSGADVDIVAIDSHLEESAWALWESRGDKYWPLVDCASFLAMQSKGLGTAVTSDHHFEQAGLVRLLK